MDRLKMAKLLGMPANSTDEQLLERLNAVTEERSNDVVSEDPTENWTISDFLEKDPEALHTMASQNPTRFKRLNAAHFGQDFSTGPTYGNNYEGNTKEQLQEFRKELMKLTPEQQYQFFEQDPEGYRKIKKA